MNVSFVPEPLRGTFGRVSGLKNMATKHPQIKMLKHRLTISKRIFVLIMFLIVEASWAFEALPHISRIPWT